jgi:hypothetical protein
MTKPFYLQSGWLNSTGVFLLLPACYVIIISLLKFELGVNEPFDSSAPVLESWGIKEAPGFNISSLLVFGPMLAILLASIQVLTIRWKFSKENWDFNIRVRKKVLPLTIIFLGMLVLFTLGWFFID